MLACSIHHSWNIIVVVPGCCGQGSKCPRFSWWSVEGVSKRGMGIENLDDWIATK